MPSFTCKFTLSKKAKIAIVGGVFSGIVAIGGVAAACPPPSHQTKPPAYVVHQHPKPQPKPSQPAKPKPPVKDVPQCKEGYRFEGHSCVPCHKKSQPAPKPPAPTKPCKPKPTKPVQPTPPVVIPTTTVPTAPVTPTTPAIPSTPATPVTSVPPTGNIGTPVSIAKVPHVGPAHIDAGDFKPVNPDNSNGTAAALIWSFLLSLTGLVSVTVFRKQIVAAYNWLRSFWTGAHR